VRKSCIVNDGAVIDQYDRSCAAYYCWESGMACFYCHFRHILTRAFSPSGDYVLTLVLISPVARVRILVSILLTIS
jgi:hypothetical protein